MKSAQEAAREALLEIMVEMGELIPLYGDYYEDMGGHIIHASSGILDSYIEDFLKHLGEEERAEILKTVREAVDDV